MNTLKGFSVNLYCSQIVVSMRNLLYFLTFFLFIPAISDAQGVSIYTVTRETGIVYNPVGDTGNWVTSWRAPGNPNNSRSYPVPLGFSFNYLGYNFTEVSVSTNGFLDFSTNSAAGDQDKPYGFDNSAFSIPSPNGTLLAIAPFYEDLMVTWGFTLTNSIRYITFGIPGDRIFVMEWAHFSLDQSNSDHVTFQVRLYEATSKIEFIYGAMSATAITPSYTCGINASTMAVPPTAAQLLTMQVPNSTVFGSTPKNNLNVLPESNSKIILTGCLLPGAAGTIDGPSHVCLPALGIIYSIPPVPAATGYIWNLPPGFSIVSGNNSFFITVNAAANANAGNVSVTAVNGCGSGAPSSRSVTVSTRPTPIVNGPAVVCTGVTEYSYSTQPSMSNYQWSVTSGGTITSGTGTNAITVVWATNGTDTVSVSYNDPNGCSSQTPGYQIITVHPTTLPIIKGPDQACITSPGNTYKTQSGMTDYLWTISPGGTITSGGGPGDSTVTVTWTSAGGQMVNVAFTDINGCAPSTPTSFPVTVNDLPVPVITGPQTPCIHSTGNVYTTQAGMVNYVWQVSPGGMITSGGTSTSNTVTVTWNTTGPQTVSVNYATPGGCTSLQPFNLPVSVGERPVPTITGPSTACPGSANNVYTTQSGMTGYTWSVSSGGIITAGGTPTSNVAVVSWIGPGPQTITVNYNNLEGCPAQTPTTFAVFVELLPVPVITGPDTVCQNSAGNVYETENGMSNYQWSVSEGGMITGGGTSSDPSVTIQWVLPGNRSVAVNYTNFTGCQTVSPGIHPVMVDTLPQPAITGEDTVCAATSGHFYMTESGMTGYEWTVSEAGEILSGAGTEVIEVRWLTAGAGRLTVTYVDPRGCVPDLPSEWNVTILSRPVPSLSGPDNACAGSGGYLYTTDPGMTHYVWTISPGGIINSGAGTDTVTVTWVTAGLQLISASYTDPEGCASQSPTLKEVSVSDLPVPSITGNTTPCVNSGSTVYSTQSGMTGYLWNVSPGGVIISGEGTNAVTINWFGTGIQWVSVNYSNPTGCSGGAPGILEVVVNPVPGAPGIVSGSQDVCAGSQGLLYSVEPVANADYYVWNLPPGAHITQGAGTPSVLVTYPVNASSGNITVFAYNTCAAGALSPPLPVTVATLPVAAGAITGIDTVARGATGVPFSVPLITNATGYQWIIPSGATISSGENTHDIRVDFSVAAEPGNFTVAGTNGCGTGSFSPPFFVRITDPPAPPVIYFSGDSLVSNYSRGNRWYLDGNPIPEATDQVLHPQQTGWFWSRVHLYGMLSDTSNNIYVVVTGKTEMESASLKVFPVPNQGKFTVSFDLPHLTGTCCLEIYNRLGILVHRTSLEPTDGKFRTDINLKDTPAGVYTVQLSNSSTRLVKKVVISR